MINKHFLQIFSLSIKQLIGLILFGSISVSFAQESDPVGSDQGNIEITSDGQPMWNLPITVPPGVLGLAPKLSLSVSPQGQLNLGGLSSISRCPGSVADHGSSKPVRFLLSDQYCLDGQPLVLISGTQGADGSIYHTKIESFQKIEAQGSQGNGPLSFVVTTRNGSKLIYGDTESSKTVINDNTAVSWGISLLEDLSGNGLWYQYENISNTQTAEIALTKIVYGSKTQDAAPVEVSFNFENRPDISSGYQLGNLVQNTKRLESITTNADSKTARIFRINYEQGQPGNYSRVNNVSECAIDDGSTEVCYRPSEFNYAESNVGWQANSSINQPDLLQDENGRARGTLIDINNDGWTDWLTAVQSETGAAVIQTWLGSQSGWTNSSTFKLPGPLFDYQINDEGIPVGNLADMNGDGLVDYFQAYHQTHADGSKTIKRTTWLNTGDGFAVNAALRPPYYTVLIRIDGTIEAYDKYVDVNGDGLPDEVRAMRRKSGTYSRITRLNTGSGWAVSTDYKIPSGVFSDHSIGSQGAYLSELIDINSDGLVDFVQSAKISDTVTHTRTYLNTGSGWSNSTAFRMPIPLTDYSVHDKGVPNAELADINGDGLLDVWQALRTEPGSVDTLNAWLNDGITFIPAPKYKPNTRGTYVQPDGDVNKLSELMDVNGDGKPEYVEHGIWESGTERFYIWEHIGTKWSRNDSLKSFLPNIPFYYHPSGKPSISLLQTADLDGDGRAEAFVSNGHTGQQQVFSTPQPVDGELAGTMTEHINGLGVATRLSYGISTMDSDLYTSGDITENSYPEAFVNSPMGLVKSVRKMDGLVHPDVAYNNENNGWYNVEHQYHGYKVDTSGRGSLGFAGRTISDVRTGVSITSEFYQSYPFTGMPKSMVNMRNGITNSQSDSEVAQNALYGDKTIFPYTSSTEANAYDPGSGDLISVTDTSSVYDDYGNPTSKIKTTRNQNQSQVFSTETLTTYKAVNDQAWILGLPTDTEVIHTSTINGITDSQKNTTTATYSAKGYPLEEILEPGGDQIQTNYQYDSFGNVKKTIITAGGETRESSTTFASQGRFPRTSVNPLGHTATVTIDSRWGKPTQQKDPNNVIKQTKYDAFGTVLREDVLWDSQMQGSEVALAYWCEGRYKSRCTAHSTSAVYFAAALDDKGESPQSVYYDAYGRELLKQTSGSDLNDNDVADGSTIYIKTVYDSEGRKIKVSRPTTTPNQFIYNIVDYDQYGRVEAKYLSTASGVEKNKVEYVYNGLSIITKTSNQDHLAQTTVVNDLRGKPVTSIDADNTVTKYKYDVKGNLLVTEVDNRPDTAISLTYDKFGRKTAMSDPDMGDWSYEYDSFGNLSKQTDAKGQQVTMVYDVLNRLTRRTEAEGTTTWRYDTPVQTNQEEAIGKLMHVSAPHDAYSRIHFYDKAMRPARERTNINGVAYYTERGYYRGSQRVAWEEYPSGLVLTKDYDPTGFPMKLESVDLNKYEDYLDAVYDYEDDVKAAKLLEAENKLELDYYRDLIEGEITQLDEYGVPVPDGNREGGLNADIQDHLNEINAEVAKAQKWIGLANDTASVLGQHTKWKNDYYAVYKASYLDPYNFNKDKAEYHADEAQRLGNLANQENNKANNYLSQAQSKVNEANSHLNSAKGNWRAACIAGGKENHDKLSGALGLNCAFGPSVDGQRFSQFGLGNGRKNACFRLSTHNDRDGAGPYYQCAQYVNAFSWLPTDSRQIRTGTTREYVCNGTVTTPPSGGGGGFGGEGGGKSIIHVAGAVVAGIAAFVEQAFGEAADNCYWRDRHSTQTIQLLRDANFGSVTSNMDAVGPKMDQYAAKMNQAQSLINSAKPHQNKAQTYSNQANWNANTAETYANTANTYVNGLQIYGALWVSHQNVEGGFGDRYDAYFNSYEVYAGKYECKKPADIPARVLYRTNDTVTYKPSPFPNGIRVSLDEDFNFVPASEIAGRDDISVWYIDHNSRRLARAIEVPKFEKEHCKTGELWAHLDDGTIGKETNQLFASNLLFNRDYYLYQYDRFSNPINDLVEQANSQLETVENLRDAYKNNAKVYWEALAYESDGQIKSARYGNDVENTWDYDESGRAGVIRAAKDSNILQNMIFHYDNVGNLISREDNSVNGKHFSETFTYDALSRLSTATLNGQGADLYQLTGNQAQSFDYDILGNITQKSDVGSYDYNAGSCLPGSFEGGPHALKSTSGAINTSFCYDLNGNQISGYDRTLEYYSYNKPSMIDKIGGRNEFAYGPERQLIYQTETVDQQARETAYVGNIYERTTKEGVSESVHHLTISGHTIAVLKTQSLDRTVGTSPYTFIETKLGTKKSLNYLHQDHLDSVVMITDEVGDVVERNHYDAFGKKRMIVPNGQVLAAGLLPITDRSFTDHRYLVGQELVHMKGRVYDPTFGRFLSADPHIQSPLNSQSLNRYSYVVNNPLSLTDPSGYIFGWLTKLFKKILKIVKKIIKKIVAVIKKVIKAIEKVIQKVIMALPMELRIIAAIAVAWFAPQISAYLLSGFGAAGTAFLAGTAGTVFTGAVGGALAGLITTGSFKGALIGGLTGAAFAGVGNFFAGTTNSALVNVTKAYWNSVTNTFANATRSLTALGHGLKTFAHGIVGGLSSKLSGGSFSKSFLSTGLVQAFAPAIKKFGGTTMDLASRLKRTAAAALVGGLSSKLAGGSFSVGARLGAMSRWFNDELHFNISVRTPSWLNKLFGSEIEGQGFTVGGAVSFPGINGDANYDAGGFLTLHGGGTDYGTGRVSLGLGYSTSDIQSMSGSGADISFNDGIGGLSASIDENGALNGVGMHLGAGYNIGGSGTITHSYGIRDAVEAIRNMAESLKTNHAY